MKQYYLSNHLGNTLAIISDKKFAATTVNGVVTAYVPETVSATDYSSFGVSLLGRQLNASNVEYGFNGKWNEIETGYQNYGMRDYSARARRFTKIDPLIGNYPWYTPYQFAGNSPISMIDLDGLEEVSPTIHYDPNTMSGYGSYPALKPSEWKISDESSATGTFATAARYNTNSLNSSVYKPVFQIHSYYIWASKEVNKVQSNIKFFNAAESVTGLFGVGGAYMFPEFAGLSNHGRKSLGDVNARLLKENMPVVREILNTGTSTIVNGKGIIWDFNYVHREQSTLEEVVSKDPLSQSDQLAINRTFSRFEIVHPEYTMAKALVGTSNLDYRNQSHREAIGRSLVFISHFLSNNNFEQSSQTPEFKSAVDYLNKTYGEKHTQDFLNVYKNKYGQ